MRLIDADAFKEAMGTETKLRKMICSAIDEQPTAYDAEKVVAELDNTKKTALDKVKTTILILNKSGLQELIDLCFEEAIKIVRKGGVEHE